MASTTSTPQGQRPRLHVRRATPADVPDMVRIHFDAFNTGVMNGLMHPGGGSESARATFGGSLLPLTAEAGEEAEAEDDKSRSPVENFIMVAEVGGGDDGEDGDARPPTKEVVAYAKWRLVREQLPEDKQNTRHEMTAEELGDGANAEVYNAFIGGLHRLTAKWWKGEPCLYLHILACSPAHQRLGAGSALLAWGAELADGEGRDAWLEASPQGYPLYRRFGFEGVDVLDLEITERWGPRRAEGEDWGQGVDVDGAGELPRGYFRSAVMKRVPRTAGAGG